jgi:hypothetical protein
MFNAEKLSAMLQDAGNEAGRLWLTRDGTTVPEAFIEFKFERDDVLLRVISRSGRELDLKVAYAEGLDGALEAIQKFMRAGRIADNRKAA